MYQWRQRTPARGGERLPAGFIIPAQPTLATIAPSGPNWLHELKHDGWRLIARKDSAQVRLWTSKGRHVTRHFEQITVAVARLDAEAAMLDGEAVVFRADGHSDFHALTSRGHGMEALMVAFDLLVLDGADLRSEPLEPRRRRLEGLLAGASAIRFSQAIEGDAPQSSRTPAGSEWRGSSRSGVVRRPDVSTADGRASSPVSYGNDLQ